MELHTRTSVNAVRSESAELRRVETDRGTIVARCIIVATNAFTSRIFPELAAIRPYQSQIMVTEHAHDRARGRVMTCDEGPAFLNQPRSGAREDRAPLLLGGGADRPMANPDSRKRSPHVHAGLLAIRDRFYPELRGVPPSAERIGGAAAAKMAISGETLDWLPEEVFSPKRLLSTEPLFMSHRKSLWRIAASMGRQMNAVNRRISEALALRTSDDVSPVPRQSAPARPGRDLRPGEPDRG